MLGQKQNKQTRMWLSQKGHENEVKVIYFGMHCVFVK